MANEEPTLNVPSLITLAAVAYFLIRWFFKTENNNAGNGTQAARNQGRIEQVNQISQMFPQIDRRAIMWDLHRNGGSLTATTERILSGTGLETPPLTYQPDIPPPPQAAPTARNPDAAQSKTASESLIARYNLADKIKAEDEGAGQESGEAGSGASSPSPASPAWSQNKNERQRLLQQRRDEMILAARRKMFEKEKAKSSGTDAS